MSYARLIWSFDADVDQKNKRNAFVWKQKFVGKFLAQTKAILFSQVKIGDYQEWVHLFLQPGTKTLYVVKHFQGIIKTKLCPHLFNNIEFFLVVVYDEYGRLFHLIHLSWRLPVLSKSQIDQDQEKTMPIMASWSSNKPLKFHIFRHTDPKILKQNSPPHLIACALPSALKSSWIVFLLHYLSATCLVSAYRTKGIIVSKKWENRIAIFTRQAP